MLLNVRKWAQINYFLDIKPENLNSTTRNINNKTKLEEITNKVFEGILQEKSDTGVHKSTQSDKGSVKVNIFFII